MTKTKITFRGWEFTVDKELTESEYSEIEKSSGESCACSNCLNYVSSRENVFPEEVVSLFDSLGVDRKKEIEISQMGKLEDGLHYYSGWFHFVGEFKGKDCCVPSSYGGSTIELEQLTENFEIGFTKAKTLSLF